jgi:NADH dehydrogenase
MPYVAVDDVLEGCVRLATTADPPESLDFGGPEALTRHEVVDALKRAVGARFRRIVVPRPALTPRHPELRRPAGDPSTGRCCPESVCRTQPRGIALMPGWVGC